MKEVTGREPARRTILERVAVVAVVALGLGARLREIDYAFDGDEVFSVELARQPLGEVISRSLVDTPHPPLYNIALHLWIEAFGPSEVSARSLSVLLSCAFLVVAYVLLRRSLVPWLAIGVLSLYALSPFFVYYGQQARPYALIAVLACANLLAFSRVLDEPREPRRLALWSASCALLLYAQYLAIVILLAEIGVALIHARSALRRILVLGAVAASLIIPWAIAAMGAALWRGADPLPSISWMHSPTPARGVAFYVSILGILPEVRPRWLLVLPFAALAAIYARRRIASSLPADHLLLLLVGFGVPALVYALSVTGPRPVFEPRQMLGAAIAFVAVIGLHLSELPKRAAAGVLVAFVAWTVAALPQASPRREKPPWRSVAAALDRNYPSTIVVAREEWVRRPLAFYRKSGPVRLWTQLAPHEKVGHLLFVCRPPVCPERNADVAESLGSVLGTWRWGPHSEREHALVLYDLDGVEARHVLDEQVGEGAR